MGLCMYNRDILDPLGKEDSKEAQGLAELHHPREQLAHVYLDVCSSEHVLVRIYTCIYIYVYVRMCVCVIHPNGPGISMVHT